MKNENSGASLFHLQNCKAGVYFRIFRKIVKKVGGRQILKSVSFSKRVKRLNFSRKFASKFLISLRLHSTCGDIEDSWWYKS